MQKLEPPGRDDSLGDDFNNELNCLLEVDSADPFDLAEGIVGFGGNDETDETFLAGEGTAVYVQGEEDGAAGIGWGLEFLSLDAGSEAVAADDFDVFVVGELAGILLNEGVEGGAGEGEGAGGAVAGADDVAVS